MKRIKISEILIIFSLLIVSFLVVIPYFHSGYFPTHDGEWAVVRLGDMYRSLKDVQLPVRFSGSLNFGYGYPLFNFAYPFPYYLGLLPYALKFGLVGSVKALFVSSVFASAIGMYVLAKEIWKSRLAGFVSAVLYVYYPYRLVDLYVRGSIGESLSFALFPFLFYSAIKIAKHEHVRLYLIFGILLLSAQIMTHNIMSVLFIPFFLIFLFMVERQDHFKHWREFALLIAGGVTLSTFFWLPALFEKGYIQLSQIPIADRSLYFVSPPQLIIPKFGYGVPIEKNGFGYYLGIAHVLTLLWIGVMLIYQKGKKHIDTTLFRFTFFFFVSSLLYGVFLFQHTAIIWENLPFFKEINYPWTILAPLGFVLSLLSGVAAIIPRFRFVAVFLFVIAVVTVLPYAKPQYYVDRGDLYYLTNEATTTSSDELMPLWVSEKPSSHYDEKVAIIEGEGTVFDVYVKSNLISFKTNLQTNSTIRVNTLYYPGWKATSTASDVPISYNNKPGVMDLMVPRGVNKVTMRFTETPVRLFADNVSFLVAITLAFYILLQGIRLMRKRL